MGNIHSREQYYDIAHEALQNARDLRYDIGGPPCRGAILAYLDHQIDADRLIHHCTLLEANEFCRLAEPAYLRWTYRYEHLFRCQARHGRCRYPRANLHMSDCEYYVPLPPGIDCIGPAFDALEENNTFYNDIGADYDRYDFPPAHAFSYRAYCDEYSDGSDEFNDGSCGSETIIGEVTYNGDALGRTTNRIRDVHVGPEGRDRHPRPAS